MSNLDESIGRLLIDLQKDDPDSFKELMKKVQKEHPELFDQVIYEENAKIDVYNKEIEDYNKKIDVTD